MLFSSCEWARRGPIRVFVCNKSIVVCETSADYCIVVVWLISCYLHLHPVATASQLISWLLPTSRDDVNGFAMKDSCLLVREPTHTYTERSCLFDWEPRKGWAVNTLS